MGQYWRLVNVDKKHELFNNGGMKFLEFFLAGTGAQLVGLLKKAPELRLLKTTQAALLASKFKSPNSHLMGLPQEIIDLIANIVYGSDGSPMIGLVFTCTYFFRLLATKLQDAIVDDYSAWAGDRLIFVGDCAKGYPAGIATPEEKTKWDALGKNPLYGMKTATVTDGSKVLLPSWPGRKAPEFRGALLAFGSLELQKEEEDLKLFKRMVGFLIRKVEYGGDPATLAPVLRNLTTKQYVRDDALANSHYAYSLGEVVVCFTMWSEEEGGCSGIPPEGEWAGHRFDIGTLADVAGEEWKDVSEQAIQMFRETGYSLRKDEGGRRVWWSRAAKLDLGF